MGSALLWDLVVTAVMAVACVLAVESRFKVLYGTLFYVDEGIGTLDGSVLLLDMLVLWTLSLLFLGITRSRTVACLLLGVVVTVALVANQYKADLRSEPLFPTDVTYLGETGLLLASAGIPVWIVWVTGAGLLAVLGAFVVLRRRRSTERRAVGWPLRVVYTVVGLAVVFLAVSFNEDDNPLREGYESAGAEWLAWDQWVNYRQNGFVAGLLYNMPATPMERPAGYDDDAMQALAEKYAQRAADINAGRDADALSGVNVMVVLSESFSDPAQLDGLQLEEDPIPFTRELMSTHPSGSVVSMGYGGGTANMEFEILTGLSTANLTPQARTPFQSLIPGRRTFPSLVGAVDGADEHATAAIHPFDGGSYRRRDVYPALGLDHLTFQDEMRESETIGETWYTSDRAVFREAIDDLKSSSEPMFLNVVTMQNHAPYVDKYPDPMLASVAAGESELAPVAGHYLRGLRHSDDALRELVASVEDLDEPTVVLFYGDHLPPGVWPGSLMDDDRRIKQYETPWLLFGNVDLDTVDSGPIGPPHLVGRLLAATGAPVTPMVAFLSDLEDELPVLTPHLILDEDDQPVALDGLSPEAQALLEEYRLIEYDQIEGRSPYAASFYTSAVE